MHSYLNQDKKNDLFVVLNWKYKKLIHMLQILHIDESVCLTFLEKQLFPKQL